MGATRRSAERAELFVVDQFDLLAGLAAGDALGVAGELELAELHAEGVVLEEAADQRLADAEDELDRLGGLDEADHAGEHAEDAGLVARGGHAGRGRLW